MGMFKEARQNRIFQDVILQIEEAILNGDLKAGDKLPAERELKDVFQTSRGTLREALRVLEQKGLITIKAGVKGGAIIKEVTTHQISESLSFLVQYQKIPLSELAEFREGVEGIVAGLATERVKKKDIEYIKTLLDETRIHNEKGISHWDEFIAVDNKFHMALAHIAGNQVYESVLRMVHNNITKYYNQYLDKTPEIMQENYQDLCEIVKAIEGGNKVKAIKIAQDHVRRFNSFMEK